MLDFSYQNILHSNTINFAIMIGFFAILIKFLKVGEKMEQGRACVQESVENSDSLKIHAEKEFKKIKDSLKDLPKEIDGILENAKATAIAFEQKSKDEIEQLVASIKVNADKQVGAEEKQAQSVLSKNIGKSSVEIAQRQVKNTFEKNKDLHRKVIGDFINDLDKLEV